MAPQLPPVGRKGLVFVISAPSGAGKTTLIKSLREAVSGLYFSVSHTTRKMRPGEKDAVHYNFIDRERFEVLREQDEFLEWAEVHGNLYGTSRSALNAELDAGHDVILDIDVQGALSVMPVVEDCVSVFIMPPSLQELKRRLTIRGESAETIDLRVNNAMSEIEKAEHYQYLIVNDDRERAASELIAVVRASRLLTRLRQDVLDSFCR